MGHTTELSKITIASRIQFCLFFVYRPDPQTSIFVGVTTIHMINLVLIIHLGNEFSTDGVKKPLQ